MPQRMAAPPADRECRERGGHGPCALHGRIVMALRGPHVHPPGRMRGPAESPARHGDCPLPPPLPAARADGLEPHYAVSLPAPAVLTPPGERQTAGSGKHVSLRENTGGRRDY